MFPLLALLLVLPSCLSHEVKDNTSERLEAARFSQRIKALKQFAETQNACCTYGILIDMSKPSSQNRLFVVNLQADSVVIAGLCAHGSGKQYNGETVIFSNEPGSLLSSEGRYKIGAKYYGAFGMSYRLHGLDSTNSKAFERAVVFHSLSCVPDEEGEPLCLSHGCPMVSPNVLKKTAALIDQVQQPMLMWVYK
ncbi:MAG: murein L,D-transpeptidase catalytic domain family protein [Chitinophagales bacterium]|nr:murein L,D-transpeptidase catalytic domain family protein [Chitinophagales bacterium]